MLAPRNLLVLYVTQSNDAEHPQARPPGKPGCRCHLVRSEIDLALGATGGAGAWAEDIAAVGPLEAVPGQVASSVFGERILDCEQNLDINIHVRRLIIERIVDVEIEVSHALRKSRWSANRCYAHRWCCRY